MQKLNRAQVVARLGTLPPLPTAVSALLASFHNDDIDVGIIAHQIGRDQALTARVLRVANSSFYGLQSKVGTINEAVVILGFRAVRSIVLAVGVNGALHLERCTGFDTLAYLRHCVAVALTARALAGSTGYTPELAFTAGILHDIGELVLASNFSRQYADVFVYRKKHDCFLLDAEREILGMDHAEIGGLLAETWHFPETLREALTDHHAPGQTEHSLADLIHVADAIARALGLANSSEEMVMPVDPAAWQRLGLDADKVSKALPQVLSGMDETCLALSG